MFDFNHLPEDGWAVVVSVAYADEGSTTVDIALNSFLAFTALVLESTVTYTRNDHFTVS